MYIVHFVNLLVLQIAFLNESIFHSKAKFLSILNIESVAADLVEEDEILKVLLSLKSCTLQLLVLL